VTADKLDELLPDLKKGMKKVPGAGRPFMGVGPVLNEPADADGVKLESIVPGSAAETAGLRPGDVILALDGQATKTFNDLRVMIGKRAIGDKVVVKLRRGEEEMEINVILMERPGE